MPEENNRSKRPHNLILENRKALTVSGVSDVDSFDETLIVVMTDMGRLTVKGYDLKLNALNVETGELSLEGSICSLVYSETLQTKGSLFSRIFK